MSHARAALIVLALLAPLVPLASAGIPEAEGWSPYDTLSEVRQVAIAKEGTTLAAVLGPAVTTPGTPSAQVPSAPRVAETDLVILTTQNGFARNGTENSPNALGRSHVAVSADGRAVATLGRDTFVGSSSSGVLKLSYLRLPVGGDWSSSSVTPQTRFLDGTAVALLMSDDGRRVAVASQEPPTAGGAGTYTLRGLTWTGSSLEQAFLHRGSGNLTSLAANVNLDVLYAAGNATSPELADNVPMVLALPWGATTPTAVYRGETVGTRVAALATDAGGRAVVAGTSDGYLLRFQPQDGALATPTIRALPGNLTHVAVSAEGSRVVALVGTTLWQLDGAQADLPPRWNVTVPGVVGRSLALNHTGGIILVSTGGSGSGVFAFGDEGGESIWRYNGEAASVAINAAGTEAVYGQRTNVNAVRIPRGIAFEYTTGLKTSEPQTVLPGGNTTFQLSVRNPGAAPERVRVEVPSGLGFQMRSEPEVVYVRPGESQRVRLVIEADADFTGHRVFNATAISLTSGHRDEATLSLFKEGIAQVSLFLNQTDQLVQPGVPFSILVGIQNNGSKDAAVGVRVDQQVTSGPAWNVTLDRDSLLLPENSRYTVQATVTPPATAANGTSTTLTFILEGPEVSDAKAVTLRINPQLGLEINAQRRAQFVEPSQRAHFNVTITNTGSVGREFEAFYDVSSSGGKSWSVDMETGTFTLEGGASRTIPVTVLAPADVTATDRVSVLVTARTVVPDGVNEAPLVGNVTLFANGATPAPTPEDELEDDVRVIPGPGLLAFLALVGLASPALRRRRNP